MISEQTLKRTVLIAPATNLNTTARSANLNCIGADYAVIILNFTAELNTNATGPVISLLEDDTTVVSNFATITADRTEDLASAHGVAYYVDTRYKQQYLRLTVTPATTTNDTVNVSADAFTGKLGVAATAANDLRGSTNDAIIIV